MRSASTPEERRARYWRQWTPMADAPAHERQVAVDYHANGTLVFEAYMGHAISADVFDAVIRAVSCLKDKSGTHPDGHVRARAPAIGLTARARAHSPRADFALAALVRAFLLCEARRGRGDARAGMTDAQRASAIACFRSFPFWLDSEGLRGEVCYWTENHQSLLLSSQYLLARRLPELAAAWGDARCRRAEALLRHFLSMKLERGFFELNSPVYSTITMAGLLNVVDLSADDEEEDGEDGVRATAEAVLRRMLALMLEVPTIDGTFACASTRFFDRDIVQREMRAVQTVVDLVFGIASERRPNNARSFQSAIIASSPWACAAADGFVWRDQVNATLPLTSTSGADGDGGAADGDGVAAALTDADRMLFSFSAGDFFPPARIKRHIALMREHGLFGHPHFRDFAFLKSMPAFSLETVSGLLSGITCVASPAGGRPQRAAARPPADRAAAARAPQRGPQPHGRLRARVPDGLLLHVEPERARAEVRLPEAELRGGARCRHDRVARVRPAEEAGPGQRPRRHLAHCDAERGRREVHRGVRAAEQSAELPALEDGQVGRPRRYARRLPADAHGGPPAPIRPPLTRARPVELLSNTGALLFRPTGDLSGEYRAGGVLNLVPPSHCRFAVEPVEVREGVFQHALCEQTKQCWLFDMVREGARGDS